MKLSNKQEHFCQEYIKDSNATRSYKMAYSVAENTKEQCIWVNASKLLSNAKVTLRIDELKKALANRNLWTREHSVKILAKIAVSTDTKPTEKTQAVKELNAMHGYNEPTKIDHQSSDGSMSPSNISSELIAEAIKNKYANK